MTWTFNGEEALTRARIAYGPLGSVYDREIDGKEIDWRPSKRFWVGAPFPDYHDGHPYGNGDSWTEALADALRRDIRRRSME